MAERKVSPATEPEVQNIVYTARLGSKLMMRYLAACFVGQYNPKRFAAAILRLKYPQCTGLFFSSGEVVCTGCKCPSDALLGLHTFKNMIENALGIELWLHNTTLWNIVCSRDLGYALDLASLHHDTQLISDHIPIVFPGIHFEFEDLGTMVTAFSSGSVIITGGSNIPVMESSFYRANKLFSRYKLDKQRSHRDTVALHKQLTTLKPQPISLLAPIVKPNVDPGHVRTLGPASTVISQPHVFLHSPFNFAALLPPPPAPPSPKKEPNQPLGRKRKRGNENELQN